MGHLLYSLHCHCPFLHILFQFWPCLQPEFITNRIFSFYVFGHVLELFNSIDLFIAQSCNVYLLIWICTNSINYYLLDPSSHSFRLSFNKLFGLFFANFSIQLINIFFYFFVFAAIFIFFLHVSHCSTTRCATHATLCVPGTARFGFSSRCYCY